MAQNREMILANFQACTGVDDVGEAIFHLEEAQWDLLAAVNRVMPQEFGAQNPENIVDVADIVPQDLHLPESATVPNAPSPTSGFTPPSPPPGISFPEGAHFLHSCVSASASRPTTSSANDGDVNMQDHAPSTSRGSPDSYVFKIKYQNMVLSIEIPAFKTVEYLKQQIHQQTCILPSQQMLTGWSNSVISETVPVRSLGIPRECTLLLAVLPNVTNDSNDKELDKMSATYTLNVTHEGGKNYCLKFPGSHTVLEVKNDIYTLTDIPARHQGWTGWPPAVKDDKTMLVNAGLQFPEHELTVRKIVPKSPLQNKRKVIVDAGESDASEEEFEDASESLTGDEDQELFMDDIPTNKMQPLIPPDTEDEMAGAIHFGEEFTNRYGAAHPEFYPGTLEDALKDSCLKPAKDRKLLALYIHHDGSVLSNVFCTQLLGSESVHECLSNYFVVWGWDITHDSNKLMLLGSVSKSLGNMAAMTIRGIQMDRLPILAILMRSRSNTEIFRIVHGNVGASELLTSLIEAVDVFSEQQVADLRDEEERAARELIKTEQDHAYQASLAVDRAKEEARKQQELLEEQDRERRDREREQQESIREAHRRDVESQLPPEPEEGSGDTVAKIRYKLPTGDHLERRFLASAQLKSLLDFLTVKGFPADNYKVITCYPRRDLSQLDPQQTLADLKLYPQETVMVEER